MRTAIDALRSMNRYIALALGDTWEVRLWTDDVKLPFPFARVTFAGPTLMTGPAMYADVTQPMVVHAYQEPQESVEAGIISALMVEDVLFNAFQGRGAGPVRSGNMRIPLYDYDGVPLDGIESGSDTRFTSDYLRVLDFSTSHLHDPQDDRNITVSADIRVMWRRPTHADPGKPVESLEVEISGG